MVAIPTKRLTGRVLTVMVGAARHTPANRLMAQVFRQQLGITKVRTLKSDALSSLPESYAPVAARPPRGIASADYGPPEQGGRLFSSEAIHQRFRTGDLTPTSLTDRTIERAYALGRDEPSANPFCAIDEKGAR